MFRATLLLFCLLAFDVAAAERLGRALFASGDGSVTRAGQSLPLWAGMDLLPGDRVRSEADCISHLRLDDGTLIAMQPSSTVLLDEARIELQGGGIQLSATSTTTPMHIRTAEVELEATAVHLNLRRCDSECIDERDAVAAAGTYGLLAHGQVRLRSGARELLVLRGEGFYAGADQRPALTRTLPRQLMAKPLPRVRAAVRVGNNPPLPVRSPLAANPRSTEATPHPARPVFSASEARDLDGRLTAPLPTAP